MVVFLMTMEVCIHGLTHCDVVEGLLLGAFGLLIPAIFSSTPTVNCAFTHEFRCVFTRGCSLIEKEVHLDAVLLP